MSEQDEALRLAQELIGFGNICGNRLAQKGGLCIERQHAEIERLKRELAASQFALWQVHQALIADEAGAPNGRQEKPPGMAVQALAGEIIAALLADEKDGGFDLTAGMFGAQFSALVRRWAAAEWSMLAADPKPGDDHE